jgi:hypothetical protein
MTAVPAIVEAIHAAGLTLTATPDCRVKVMPADRLTGELANLIRANKPALLDWLRQAANDSADPDRWCWPNDPSPDAAMNASEIEILASRTQFFMRRGLDLRQAEKLADKLTRRDREGDDRRACIECQRLTHTRNCTAWQQAGVGGPVVGDLLTMPQRCPAFAPAIEGAAR